MSHYSPSTHHSLNSPLPQLTTPSTHHSLNSPLPQRTTPSTHHSLNSPLPQLTTPSTHHSLNSPLPQLTTPSTHHSLNSPLPQLTTPSTHHSLNSPLPQLTTPSTHHSLNSPLPQLTTPSTHHSLNSPLPQLTTPSTHHSRNQDPFSLVPSYSLGLREELDSEFVKIEFPLCIHVQILVRIDQHIIVHIPENTRVRCLPRKLSGQGPRMLHRIGVMETVFSVSLAQYGNRITDAIDGLTILHHYLGH
ncbi:uncharacterized protein N7511_004319 [Penicillium nucicola]|uniref:uncharacterized protein n=1 Tax=Penicillium nucicola TaxID=1850975 RepID=UPI002544FD06|nr:uncharacterized protein N7511_004319 [Penicillium nucicola]KAJ5766703.1 hypothetical protein N7511_004319 [Penicillium nucicola]